MSKIIKEETTKPEQLRESQTKKLLALINKFRSLQKKAAEADHPLFREFNSLCSTATDLIGETIAINDNNINKIVYNYRLIEQLNNHIIELKNQYNKDKKKLTESLGSAYLHVEEISERLQTDANRLNEMLEDRVNDLLRENSSLKQIARSNLKESQLKTDFLNVLTHELRTPLNAIIGYSQIIKNGIYGPVNESIDNDVDAINKNGKHLLTLINQMLDFAKYGSGKIQIDRRKVSLENLFDSVIKQLNSLIAAKPIQFHIIQKEGVENGFFDRDRIFQVLTNLVGNAIHHTEQGFIKLISDYEEKNRVLILKCEDSGIGISAENMERVFEPFQQVHREKSSKETGTGLGLAICKKIVELHNGTIVMEARKDGGTVVTIRLPQR
jgi:signal transduction histidine kinase